MDLEALVTQNVNTVTVLQAAGLFVLARVGLVLLRWVGRLLKFGFYLAGSPLLRVRWVVWCCAYVLARWQVDLGSAILDLHPDHLIVTAEVTPKRRDPKVGLSFQHEGGKLASSRFVPTRLDQQDQNQQWAARTNRRNRRDEYFALLKGQLERVYRFPSDM